MTDLTPLLTELREAGYRTQLWDDGREWVCTLCCGIDVLPVEVPRPQAYGATPEAALLAANVARLEIEAGRREEKP